MQALIVGSSIVEHLLPFSRLCSVICACAVCTALTATCKLISADLLVAVLAPVVKLLDHEQPLVRYHVSPLSPAFVCCAE